MRTFLASPPVSAFAMVMGLSGLSLSWTKFAHATNFAYAHSFSQAFGLLAATVFIVLIIGLLRKLIQSSEKVVEEWNHPVKSSFFGAISVGICLLAAVAFPYSEQLAQIVWVVGATFHLFAMLAVLNAWVHRENLQAAHACPVWFIPAVGKIGRAHV